MMRWFSPTAATEHGLLGGALFVIRRRGIKRWSVTSPFLVLMMLLLPQNVYFGFLKSFLFKTSKMSIKDIFFIIVIVFFHTATQAIIVVLRGLSA
jgi:hypothetical protein